MNLAARLHPCANCIAVLKLVESFVFLTAVPDKILSGSWVKLLEAKVTNLISTQRTAQILFVEQNSVVVLGFFFIDLAEG